jgi:hypothetical protein
VVKWDKKDLKLKNKEKKRLRRRNQRKRRKKNRGWKIIQLCNFYSIHKKLSNI